MTMFLKMDVALTILVSIYLVSTWAAPSQQIPTTRDPSEPIYIDIIRESADDYEQMRDFAVLTERQPIHEHRNFLEGDMILTPDQYFTLHKEDSDANVGHFDNGLLPLVRTKRKALRQDRYLWTNRTVFYKIKVDDFRRRDLRAIKRAMREWRRHTCVSFKEADDTTPDYVHFVNGDSCATFTGRKGGRQPLYLARSCRNKKTVLHEIGHTLGFVHEHNRPDRDDYVKIHFRNVERGSKKNFKKYSLSTVRTMGVPYDYKSIMHYGPYFFSSNRRPTITVTKDRTFQKVIGRGKGLSFGDIKQANLMYKCSARCDPSITCPKEGFLGKDCKCYCPGSPIRKCSLEKLHRAVTAIVGHVTSVLSNRVLPGRPSKCKDRWRNRCPILKARGGCERKTIAKACPKACGTCFWR